MLLQPNLKSFDTIISIIIIISIIKLTTYYNDVILMNVKLLLKNCFNISLKLINIIKHKFTFRSLARYICHDSSLSTK